MAPLGDPRTNGAAAGDLAAQQQYCSGESRIGRQQLPYHIASNALHTFYGLPGASRSFGRDMSSSQEQELSLARAMEEGGETAPSTAEAGASSWLVDASQAQRRVGAAAPASASTPPDGAHPHPRARSHSYSFYSFQRPSPRRSSYDAAGRHPQSLQFGGSDMSAGALPFERGLQYPPGGVPAAPLAPEAAQPPIEAVVPPEAMSVAHAAAQQSVAESLRARGWSCNDEAALYAAMSQGLQQDVYYAAREAALRALYEYFSRAQGTGHAMTQPSSASWQQRVWASDASSGQALQARTHPRSRSHTQFPAAAPLMPHQPSEELTSRLGAPHTEGSVALAQTAAAGGASSTAFASQARNARGGVLFSLDGCADIDPTAATLFGPLGAPLDALRGAKCDPTPLAQEWGRARRLSDVSARPPPRRSGNLGDGPPAAGAMRPAVPSAGPLDPRLYGAPRASFTAPLSSSSAPPCPLGMPPPQGGPFARAPIPGSHFPGSYPPFGPNASAVDSAAPRALSPDRNALVMSGLAALCEDPFQGVAPAPPRPVLPPDSFTTWPGMPPALAGCCPVMHDAAPRQPTPPAAPARATCDLGPRTSSTRLAPEQIDSIVASCDPARSNHPASTNASKASAPSAASHLTPFGAPAAQRPAAAAAAGDAAAPSLNGCSPFSQPAAQAAPKPKVTQGFRPWKPLTVATSAPASTAQRPSTMQLDARRSAAPPATAPAAADFASPTAAASPGRGLKHPLGHVDSDDGAEPKRRGSLAQAVAVKRNGALAPAERAASAFAGCVAGALDLEHRRQESLSTPSSDANCELKRRSSLARAASMQRRREKAAAAAAATAGGAAAAAATSMTRITSISETARCTAPSASLSPFHADTATPFAASAAAAGSTRLSPFSSFAGAPPQEAQMPPPQPASPPEGAPGRPRTAGMPRHQSMLAKSERSPARRLGPLLTAQSLPTQKGLRSAGSVGRNKPTLDVTLPPLTWEPSAGALPKWLDAGKLRHAVRRLLDKPFKAIKEAPAPARVDRRSTRVQNDRLGLQAEERRALQVERNRQTARLAVERRREEVKQLETKVQEVTRTRDGILALALLQAIALPPAPPTASEASLGVVGGAAGLVRSRSCPALDDATRADAPLARGKRRCEQRAAAAAGGGPTPAPARRVVELNPSMADALNGWPPEGAGQPEATGTGNA